jgi:hypothetical protein
MIWLSLLAFLVGLATDWIWSKWLIAIHEKRELSAANWSVLIYFCSFLGTFLVLKQAALPIILYVVGGWIGTYLAVKFSKDKSNDCKTCETCER